MQIKTLVERRDQIQVVQWQGFWEEAHEFAILFPGAAGFAVLADGHLMVYRDAGCGGSVTVKRGDFIELENDRVTNIRSREEVYRDWQDA